MASCHGAPARKPQPPQGDPVLRLVYRDASATMLIAMPASPGAPRPTGDCAAPLLLDPATGAAHAISPQEAGLRLKTMQLAGATPGTCPRRVRSPSPPPSTGR